MAKTRHVGSDFVDALPADGERRLMLAVLIDAIRTLSSEQPTSSHPHPDRRWVRELTWLQSDDHTYPFSFINICSALGFDADYVRRHVLHLPAYGRRFHMCRYAAKVGESWQLQRRALTPRSTSAPDGTQHRTGRVLVHPTATRAIAAVSEPNGLG